ncbi:alpha/beta fold hydrolase [Streptomyces sp. NPDC006678]|uniref:alpha/beta hydrolase n=1 Tax=Streptomyces sp. NPDC006678 TaxID=3157185 RepID=UPI0033CBF9A7
MTGAPSRRPKPSPIPVLSPAQGRSPISPLPAPTSTHRIRLPDGAEVTAYLDGPADAPLTVVLVHGLSVTADLWRVHTQHLADRGMRVVRYDQRAHGRSTRGTARITLEGLADDLAHIIERLAPHGPLALAGHSMGGMILQTLTMLRPDLLPASTDCC